MVSQGDIVHPCFLCNSYQIFQRLLIQLSRDARLLGLTVQQRQFGTVLHTSLMYVGSALLLDWPDVSLWQNALVLVRQMGERAKVEILCALIICWTMSLEVTDSHMIHLKVEPHQVRGGLKENKGPPVLE